MVRLGMFSPRIKCCGWVPALPNFLAGEILAEGQANGSAERVVDWITAGRGDPLYVNTPPRLQVLHRRVPMPCPLLDSSDRCSIYEHRPYLCIAYHCTYPPSVVAKAFWTCLGSLFALHSAVLAQYLVGKLGVDREQYSRSWEGVDEERSVWAGDVLRPEFSSALWQGEEDHSSFYARCYHYVCDHRQTIRAEVDAFRRKQLLRTLPERGEPSSQRQSEIEVQSTSPEPMEAPATWYGNRLVTLAGNPFTLTEHESHLLWLANRCGRV